MIRIIGFSLLVGSFAACVSTRKNQSAELADRKIQNEDSTFWNDTLLQQDKTTYSIYGAYFSDLPLTVSPFPVADYDYAVASFPLELNTDSIRAKGIAVGFYPNPDSEEVSVEMALFFVTADTLTSENSFVQSRNYPYLTAQGMMCFDQHTFDWIFVQSPEENTYLFVNMKLFDLQFGKTVLVYPQTDGSFYYRQLPVDPSGYADLDRYQAEVIQALLH